MNPIPVPVLHYFIITSIVVAYLLMLYLRVSAVPVPGTVPTLGKDRSILLFEQKYE
jgi:hypothetical protein